MWSGEAFRDRRVECRVTQRQLAVALDVTETTIQNWERGKYIPTLKPRQTYNLCKLLNLSLEEFASFEQATEQADVPYAAFRKPRQLVS